ncbi:MAG: hypothetical protein HFH09_04260 [Bacilli bacterium]|nr:hypothetical protein [Bacilli bacterium]
MEHMIFLNGRQVNVIAYFMFEATRNHYLIYCDPDNNVKIYLGKVVEKDGIFEIREIEKTESFLMKKFIQELITKSLATIKGYRYADKLSELQDNFTLIDNQEIVLDEEKRKSLEDFVKDVNEHNQEILEKAKEEYYLQLVDEKAKERRTIILLLLVLIVCIFLIVKMVLDFSARM